MVDFTSPLPAQYWVKDPYNKIGSTSGFVGTPDEQSQAWRDQYRIVASPFPAAIREIRTAVNAVDRPATLAERRASGIPRVTKYQGNPIATRAQVGLSTIYVPCLVKTPASVYAANPGLGKWRIYTSTDHDTGAGGVAMLYTDATNPDDPGATWIPYRTPGGSAKMFQLDASAQVETPCVVWNPDTSLYHLYYQYQTGGGSSILQTSAVATSPDGITFTVVGDAFPNPASSIAGYDHTGYAKVWYIDGLWVAYTLMGGGTGVSSSSWWYSYDGLSFIRDPRRLRGQLQWAEGTLRGAVQSLFRWRGRLYATGVSTAFVSGASSSTVNQPWMAPMNNNLQSIQGRPQYFNFAPTGTETVPTSPPTYWAEADDGRLWGAYRINGATGSLGLAVLSA